MEPAPHREAKRGPADPGWPEAPDELATEETDESEQRPARPRRIRCPACGWRPRPSDHWMCSCMHSWNTFETAGLCPQCGKQWGETQCPRCGVWSRHEHWYEPTDESSPDPSG